MLKSIIIVFSGLLLSQASYGYGYCEEYAGGYARKNSFTHALIHFYQASSHGSMAAAEAACTCDTASTRDDIEECD